MLSADAKASLERRGQRGYVDATNEEGPDDAPRSSSEQPGAEDSTEVRNRDGQEARDVQMRSNKKIGGQMTSQV